MKLDTLQDLFVNELKDIYHAENQIVKALPQMAEAASSPELYNVFNEHLKETHGHIERLQQVFDILGLKLEGKRCKGMEGLLEEGKELQGKNINPDILDAGLIAAAQKVEHYEIASYGTVRTYAEMLGHTEAAELLQMTLNEEKETDQRLTHLAENGVNMDALEAE